MKLIISKLAYKWFLLECAYYSMVFIALVYNIDSQNILRNDWYACLYVLSKQLAVWNAQFVCWVIMFNLVITWGITTILSCFFPLIHPCTGIESVVIDGEFLWNGVNILVNHKCST